MIKKRKKYLWLAALSIMIAVFTLSGCSKKNNPHGLTPDNPQEITVWHYYNGAQAIAFDAAVDEFNNTVGLEKGILVSAQGKSSIEDLTDALLQSASKAVGAEEMPNILQCYQNTAITLNELTPFINLNDYITEEEKAQYVDSYIEEGIIGEKNEWKLFPVAKSTEVLSVNKTGWDKFSNAVGADINKFSTWEGITELAGQYYQWSGGKSFFGRDAFANYIIIGSKQLGSEIIQVNDREVTLQIDDAVMKKLWDNFYIPYVKGYYKHVGRYRSDDVKIGEIISCICSTSAISYFPSEVTIGEEDPYTIERMILPVPNFEGCEPYAVQQGASMAVTQSAKRAEYASIVFLKWLTESDNNIKLSFGSGYLPVKKEANNFTKIENYYTENNLTLDDLQLENLQVSIKQVNESALYTMKGFKNGEQARKILEYSMIDQAIADREQILLAINNGITAEEAIKPYLEKSYFTSWLTAFRSQLEETCQ